MRQLQNLYIAVTRDARPRLHTSLVGTRVPRVRADMVLQSPRKRVSFGYFNDTILTLAAICPRGINSQITFNPRAVPVVQKLQIEMNCQLATLLNKIRPINAIEDGKVASFVKSRCRQQKVRPVVAVEFFPDAKRGELRPFGEKLRPVPSVQQVPRTFRSLRRIRQQQAHPTVAIHGMFLNRISLQDIPIPHTSL